MEVCSYSYFWWSGYFRCPWVSFITTDEFSIRVTKINSNIDVSWTRSFPFYFWPILTQWIMAISKWCKPDNFESHNFLKLSFTNIWGLCSNFVDCEFFFKSDSPDIPVLCEATLDNSIDSGNFPVRGYLPLIWKDSTSHMHALEVYVKEGLLFACDLFLENSADSDLCFRLALLHPVSYFVFLYWSSSLLLCIVFDSISSNIDEVFSINPSSNAFVIGDFNVHQGLADLFWWTWSTWWTLL